MILKNELFNHLWSKSCLQAAANFQMSISKHEQAFKELQIFSSLRIEERLPHTQV
jgi:hypothetical protein